MSPRNQHSGAPARALPLPRRQTGFSLVELSIAILIALFLIGGIIVVEQGVHRAHLDQSGTAQLQDEERFAMSLITEVVQSGGYYPTPNQVNEATALPPVGNFQAKQAVYSPTSSSRAPYDSIYVRYMSAPGDGIEQCDGTTNTSGANVKYTSYLYLAADPNGNGDDLYCQVEANTTWGTAVPLVNGLTNMQIWYGVNTSGSITNNVDTYITPANMTTSNWLNVSSVMIKLTFANPLAKLPGQPATVTFERVIGVMGRV